ncbi:LysR substrate-binding domain-containing protein [Chelativorans sp. AA-79]|uniref:LysR substrate-binding domain-containing protein n=1 Tax=Chelativorans sp. AA-79 TaxID=3028735 RepID=UPI0023F8AED3|nr:LysR substrate-binding domain-containing protein [Chelativorans sp. AA-79]WEX07997.1 LysR substrate-binding domain-containing protein [Chelativorans sp. AA-79]
MLVSQPFAAFKRQFCHEYAVDLPGHADHAELARCFGADRRVEARYFPCCKSCIAPGISIDVRPWSSGTLDDLEEGRVDFGLYTDDPLPPGFKFQPLFKENYVCLARRDHPTS